MWFAVCSTLAGRQQANQPDDPGLAWWKDQGLQHGDSKPSTQLIQSCLGGMTRDVKLYMCLAVSWTMAGRQQAQSWLGGRTRDLQLYVCLAESRTLAGRQQAHQPEDPVLAWWKDQGPKALCVLGRLLDLGRETASPLNR